MTKEVKDNKVSEYRRSVFAAKAYVDDIQETFYRIMLSVLGYEIRDEDLKRLDYLVCSLEDSQKRLRDVVKGFHNG